MQSLARFQALVIGVGTYEYVDDLPETANDATEVRRALIDPLRCGYPRDRVELLIESSATRGNILAGLATMARNAVGDTTTIVYFSGHGGQSRDDPGATYLLPREANPDDLARTAISNVVLSEALAQIHSRRLVVVLDACHASGAASFKGAKSADHAEKGFSLVGNLGQRLAGYQLRQGSGRVIFASSRREQLSWTYPAERMSLFTYYLIQGLRGRAPTTGDVIRVFDIFDYVGKQVRAKRHNQEPLLEAQDVSENFPIALSRGDRKDGNANVQLPAAAPSNDLAVFRDGIVQRADIGIRDFALYLRSMPVELLEAAGSEPADIDLKLAQFNGLEKRIRLHGHSDSWEAQRSEVVHYFIQLCIDLERILYV